MSHQAARVTAILIAVILAAVTVAQVPVPALGQGGDTASPTADSADRVPFTVLLPPGAWAIVPLDGQPVPDEEWTYVGATGRHSLSFWSLLATPTPPPPTQSPTDTPSLATPTNTPSLTPSTTPTASPTPTPSPSRTPNPQCMVTVVTTVALNLRGAPDVGAPALAKAQPGTTWEAVAVQFVDVSATRVDEWVQVRLADGRLAWMAAYYQNTAYVRYPNTADCALLRFGPGKDEPTSTPRPSSTPTSTPTSGPTAIPVTPPTPTQETFIGVWVGPGVSRSLLDEFVTISQQNGQRASFVVYGDCDTMALLKNRGALVIARGAWPDRPDFTLTPERSAELHVNRVMAQVGNCAWDLVVLTNEVTDWPSPGYRMHWIAAAKRQMDLWGGRRAIPFVEATGHFWLDDIEALRPALTDMAAWGWPLGLNLYPAEQAVQTTSICTKNLWTTYTTYRPLLYRSALPAGLDIVVTELGNGWGDHPVSAEDVRCFLARMGPGVLTSASVWYLANPALGAWPRANQSPEGVRAIGRCCAD